MEEKQPGILHLCPVDSPMVLSRNAKRQRDLEFNKDLGDQ